MGRQATRELVLIAAHREAREPREREPVHPSALQIRRPGRCPSVCLRYGSGYSSTSARNSAEALRAIVCRDVRRDRRAGILAKIRPAQVRIGCCRRDMWHNFCNRVRVTKDGRLAQFRTRTSRSSAVAQPADQPFHEFFHQHPGRPVHHGAQGPRRTSPLRRPRRPSRNCASWARAPSNRSPPRWPTPTRSRRLPTSKCSPASSTRRPFPSSSNPW